MRRDQPNGWRAPIISEVTMHCPSPFDRRGKAAVVIVAVVAVAAIAFAVYWFALRGGGEASKLVDAYVPAEADYVGGVDVAGAMKSDLVKSLATAQGLQIEALKAQLAERGINLDDLKAVAFGASAPTPGSPPSDFVAVAKGTFDANALKGALTTAEVAAAAKGIPGVSFDSVEALDGGVLIGGTGSLVDKSKALAGGGGRSAGDNAELKAVRGAIDEGATFWVAGPIPADMPLDGLDMVPGMGEGGAGKPTHFALSAGVGKDLELKLAVRFDADVAAMVKQLDGLLSMAKAVATGPEGEVLKELEIAGSGQVLKASVRLSQAALETLAKEGGGGMMPF